MGVRITIHVDGDVDEQASSTPAEWSDERDRLIHALQEATETRDRFERQLAAQTDLLRTRTVERDHFVKDSLLWGCVLAYLIDQEIDAELQLPADAVNAMQGAMLNANVDDGTLRIVIQERPGRSEEAGG